MSVFRDMAHEDPCGCCGWHTQGNFTFTTTDENHHALTVQVCDSCEVLPAAQKERDVRRQTRAAIARKKKK